MARARTIKPGLFINDDFAALPAVVRLAFPGLWCIADRAGRIEDRPAKIKAQVLPYDDADMDDVLQQLADAGFLIRYEVAGRRYLQVLNFTKHQSPHVKEPASTIPAPDLSDTGPMLDPLDPDPDPLTGIRDRACAHDTTPAPGNSSDDEEPIATSLEEASSMADDLSEAQRIAAAALRTGAARRERQLSAGQRAAGWRFSAADMALLCEARESIQGLDTSVDASELPAEVGRRLAKTKTAECGAYELWFALGAPEAAAWLAGAVALALNSGYNGIDYVTGILRSRLTANRPPFEPARGGATNLVNFPTAPAAPAEVRFKDKPWYGMYYGVEGMSRDDRERLCYLVEGYCHARRWPVERAEALAIFDASGMEAAMDHVWSRRPTGAKAV